MNLIPDLFDLIFHPVTFLNGTFRMFLVIACAWAVVGLGRLVVGIFQSEKPLG